MNRIMYFIDRWLSRSGDTTFWSWMITALYVLVIILAFRYLKKIRSDRDYHMLWLAISIFLLAMGINKQLDIQTLFLMSGRYTFFKLGLWRYGRTAIKILALLIFGGTAFAILWVFIRTRPVLHRAKSAVAGVLILIFFALIRAGSMLGIRDILIIQYIIWHIHALELLGLLLILLSLAMNFRSIKKGSPVLPSELPDN